MSSTTFACPEHLNITMVETFRTSLLASLEQRDDIQIDVSPITKVDTTGVQLLLVYLLDIKNMGGEVSLCGRSEPLQNTITMLGLTEQFPFT